MTVRQLNGLLATYEGMIKPLGYYSCPKWQPKKRGAEAVDRGIKLLAQAWMGIFDGEAPPTHLWPDKGQVEDSPKVKEVADMVVMGLKRNDPTCSGRERLREVIQDFLLLLCKARNKIRASQDCDEDDFRRFQPLYHFHCVMINEILPRAITEARTSTEQARKAK